MAPEVGGRDPSLDNMRLLAAFTVVLTHVAAILGMQRNEFGSTDWWVASGFHFSSRWCVPVWVMLSGALLLGSSKVESLREFYARRASRVVLPLLVWSFVYSIWTFFIAHLKGTPLHIEEQILRCLNGNSYYHLWYLYMVAFLYLFTPFFRMIVRQASSRHLLFFIVVGFIFQEANLVYDTITGVKPNLFINGFLVFVPYYFLGYLLRRHLLRLKMSAIFIFLFSVSVAGFLGWSYFSSHGGKLSNLFYSYVSLPVIGISISVFLLCDRLKKPLFGPRTSSFAQATLGIYLIHAIALDVIGRLLFGLKLSAILLIPLATIAVFLVSGISTMILQRFKSLRWMV
ncbi:MAG: acyltransferase family protein [Fibrobacteres bacterium]|nr:acyltransferase family protein [Fibrobacterota bacterium]